MIHAQNEKYRIFHENNQKNWKISKSLRKQNYGPSVCLPAHLLALYLLKTFAVFDKAAYASCGISDFNFYHEFHMVFWLDLL